MLGRGNVIDEADLARAVAKRFNGKTTAKSPVVGREAQQLS